MATMAAMIMTAMNVTKKDQADQANPNYEKGEAPKEQLLLASLIYIYKKLEIMIFLGCEVHLQFLWKCLHANLCAPRHTVIHKAGYSIHMYTAHTRTRMQPECRVVPRERCQIPVPKWNRW